MSGTGGMRHSGAITLLLLTTLVHIGFPQTYYTASTENILNPCRGTLISREPGRPDGITLPYVPQSVATLQSFRGSQSNAWSRNPMSSLVQINYYLGQWRGSALPQAFIDSLNSEAAHIRAAGLKLVLRFSYCANNSTDPHDADADRVCGHIRQLHDYFNNNKDILYVVQVGWIGWWGEGGTSGAASSYYYGYEPDHHTVERRKIYDSTLYHVPSNVWVMGGMGVSQRWCLYDSTSVTSATAFDGSKMSRLGLFDDSQGSNQNGNIIWRIPVACGGTRTMSDSQYTKTWWQNNSEWLMWGGELASGDTTSEWVGASQPYSIYKENQRWHANWFNCTEWGSPDPVTHFINLGIWDSWRKSLGYRHELVSSTIPGSVTSGGSFHFQAEVKNTGWGNQLHTSKLNLLLRNNSTLAVTTIPLFRERTVYDPRFWHPNVTTTLDTTVTLPAMAAGTYSVLLSLPDTNATISTRPEYAIHFANTTANGYAWESRTGFNDLGVDLVVSGNK